MLEPRPPSCSPELIFGPPAESLPSNGLVALAVVRDERDRLPFWLAYHRWLGIDHFCIVDHRSTDGTRHFLADQDDVTVYGADGPFGGEHGKFHWLSCLIKACRNQGWLAILDADELLIALPWRRSGLRDTIEKAEHENADAIVASLVDCYPASLTADTRPAEGVWWNRSPWFDTGPYVDWSHPVPFPETVYGGIRERLFWPHWRKTPKWRRRLMRRGEPPCMSKVPLIKAGSPGRFVNNHRVDGITVAKGTLAILHYKFESDLARKTDIALAERQYYRQSQEYRFYRPLLKRGETSLLSPRSRQLTAIESLFAADICQWTYDASLDTALPVAAEEIMASMV